MGAFRGWNVPTIEPSHPGGPYHRRAGSVAAGDRPTLPRCRRSAPWNTPAAPCVKPPMDALLGRDDELAAAAQAVAEVARGGTRTLGLIGETGIGKSALLGAIADAARATACSSSRASRPSTSATCPFGVFIDAPRRARGRRLHPRRLEALAPDLGAVLPSPPRDVPVPAGARGRALPHAPRVRVADGGARARAPAARAAARRPALGRLRRRSSCSARLLRRPPARAGADRVRACARARCPRGWPARWSAPAASPRSRSGRSRTRTRSRCSPASATRRCATTAREAAATRSTSSSSRAPRSARPARAGQLLAGLPPTAAAALRELALLSGPARRAARGRRRGRRPVRARARRGRRRDRTDGEALESLDELWRRDLVRADACPRAASASAIRSCAAPSTRQRAGGWRLAAHERCAAALARPRRGRGGARVPRRALRAPRRRGGDRPAREAGDAAPTPRPPRRRAGTPRRPGCCPDAARDRRAQLLAPMADALAAAGRLEESRAALVEALDAPAGGGAAAAGRGVRGRRAPARPPRRRPPAPARRARRRAGRPVAVARARAGDQRVLPGRRAQRGRVVAARGRGERRSAAARQRRRPARARRALAGRAGGRLRPARPRRRRLRRAGRRPARHPRRRRAGPRGASSSCTSASPRRPRPHSAGSTSPAPPIRATCS